MSVTTPANLPSQVGAPGGAPTDVLSIALFLSQFVQAVNSWVAKAANAVNWLLLPKATAQANSSLGYAVTATTAVALGMGVNLKPATTGRVLVIATGVFQTSASTTVTHAIRYGKGSSPAQGAGISSAAQLGATNTPTDNTSVFGYAGWALNGVALNLTPGQPYWFDVGFSVNANSATVYDVSVSAVEI